MNKLYFLMPDERTATDVVADLTAKGVPETAIGVVARDPVSNSSVPEPDASTRAFPHKGLRSGVGIIYW
jgi:hypothetical protein